MKGEKVEFLGKGADPAVQTDLILGAAQFPLSVQLSNAMTRPLVLAQARPSVMLKPNESIAQLWVGMLRDEGVQAMIRPSDAVSFMGVTALECRVQVVEEDLEKAREVLGEDAET